MKLSRRHLLTLASLATASGMVACSASGSGKGSSAPGSDRGTPSPMEVLRTWIPSTLAFAAPMVGFGRQLEANGMVGKVDVQTWASVDVLTSLLVNGEADVAATPSYVSANLYNKGADLRLAAITVWGMLYLLGPSEVTETDDLGVLRGKRVGVPMPNNMPDLVFRYLLKEQSVPTDELEIVPFTEPQELLNAFVQGGIEFAVLLEHPATVAIAKATQAGRQVTRVANLQKVWAKVTGGEARFPMAGIAVSQRIATDTSLLGAILNDLGSAVAQVNAAEDATVTKIAETTQVDAGIVKQVIPRLQLEMVPANDAKQELTNFFTRLSTLSPDIIGGKLPDEEFFLVDPR